MKKQLLIAVLTVIATLNTSATIYFQGNLGAYTGETSQGGVANGAIPDGNPNGAVNQMNLSGLGSSLSSVSVILNLSGGYNGDLYGYLSYNGVAVVLLNRVGVTAGTPFGNNGSSINIQLSDIGTANIHNPVNGLANQTYNVDNNQNVNPVALASAFTSSSAGALSAFNGANPNGTWTLFLADVSGGGGNANASLLGWGLDISAVPEPTTWALMIFAVLFAGMAALSRSRSRRTVGSV